MTEQKPAITQTPDGLLNINTQAGGFLPAFKNFDEVWRWCDMVSRSNFAPKAFKGQPADILIAVQFGSEIGLKWLQSLQSIAVVNGVPSIYGDAALALVRSSGLLEEFDEWLEVDGVRTIGSVDVIEADKSGKTVVQFCRSKRKGMTARTTFFGAADAKQMKLWLKKTKGQYGDIDSPWVTVPQRMLMFRARSWNLRDNFGDVLKGLAFYEEAMDLDATDRAQLVTEAIHDKSQPATKGLQVQEKLTTLIEERKVETVAAPPVEPVQEAEVVAREASAQPATQPPADTRPPMMDHAWADFKLMASEDHQAAYAQVKKEFKVKSADAVPVNKRWAFYDRVQALASEQKPALET